MVNISIGYKLKIIREKIGISQAQMANFLGVDQSFVSKCEKDERQFSMDMLEKICNLIGCLPGDLLKDDFPQETLTIAFRANTIDEEDLLVISEVNKIALNLDQMRILLED